MDKKDQRAPKQKANNTQKQKEIKLQKKYNEMQMTMRRKNNELIKKTAPCAKGKNC